MCGIAGVLYRDSRRPVDHNQLVAMGDRIAHRGPDGEGYWSEPGIGLVHRRLSIIDLAGGAQPMGNEDGSIQVVFNGEIYNYQQLRDDLASRGHRFRTNSDTEVLVHLYEEEGEALVQRLRGMFAFALWDCRQRRLLLGRDRVGQKPLYYYRDEEKLLFGSELKTILAHPNVDRSIDCDALDNYFRFGVIPGEQSIFAKARKLPAAHTLRIDHDNFAVTPKRYWSFTPHAEPAKSVADWQAALEAKLVETVDAHRIADVPVGAFLSGGVDSSVMVGVFSELSDTPVQTFSIGFEEREFSELPHARAVAEHFGCRHVEYVVTPEAVSSLDDLITYYDEPFADSSAIPTMHVSRLAREHVKVAISGDGGDEAFGGYARYAHDLQEAKLREQIPSWVRERVLGALAQRWPKADWLPRFLRAKTLLTNLSLPPAKAYANTLSIVRMPDRGRLLAQDVIAQLNERRSSAIVEGYYRQADPRDPLAGMTAADVGMLLPDDFLTKVDRASMSCGLEVRPPLVDHELLELAGRIPSTLKIRNGTTKWIFKELYRKRLPEAVTQRPKQGFEIPVDRWLRGPLRDMFESLVLQKNSLASQYINRTEAERLFRAHQARTGRLGHTLWALLVFAKWCDHYMTDIKATTDGSTAQRVVTSSARAIG